MSCKERGHGLDRLRLPPRKTLVAFALANYQKDEPGKAWLSQKSLCVVNGLSHSSIDQAVRDLTKCGNVTVTK